MSSLMHNIYDVVDASVNHSSHNKSKTLRVKLTVTPEPRSHRREAGTGRRRSTLCTKHCLYSESFKQLRHHEVTGEGSHVF